MCDPIQSIATRLRGLREALELTQEEVAASCNLPVGQYREMESGTADFSVNVLQTISRHYGIDPCRRRGARRGLLRRVDHSDHPVTGGLRAAVRLHGKKGGAAIRARPLFSFAGCVSRRAGRRTSSRLRCDPCRRRACIGFRRRAIRRRSASCRKSFRR